MSRLNRNIWNWRHCLMLLPWVFIAACSSSNAKAPAQGKTHDSDYLLIHAAEANADLNRCTTCHRDDFKGTGPETSCLTCHDQAPSFTIHDLPYSDAALHGTAAGNNMLKCLSCHGTLPNNFDGGILADPALYNNPKGNCSAAECHPAAGAHPTNWVETDSSTNGYRSTHINVSFLYANCSICHDYTEGRTAPNPSAPSCFSAQFTNADGSTSSCHPGGGVSSPHVIPYTAPDSHGADAKADLAACQECHGIPGTIQFNGGKSLTSCSTDLCHPDAGAHPTNWVETDSSTNGYRSTHTNAGNRSSSCSICHDYTEGRTAPNPSAPSCFSAQFTNADGSTSSCHTGGGISAPHSIPYTSPASHGSNAKSDLAACQECHGTPGSIQFNGGTASTSCATALCHPDAGAHPTNWTETSSATNGYRSTHTNAGNRSTSCSICHDYIKGRTAPNSSSPSCFTGSFTNADGITSECHDND
jgi:hypothetical protein